MIDYKLFQISQIYNCDKLCVCCYKHLLDNYYHFKRVETKDKIKVYEFASLHPIGTYIVRLEGHLTCMVNGKIWDLWNCNDEYVDIAWKVN